MKAVALSLVFLFFFLAFSLPVSAYYNINATDDSYGDQSSPTSNFGTYTTFAIRNYGGYLERSYLAFNVSSLPSGEDIISATLFVKNYGGAVPAGGAHPWHNETVFLVYNTTYFNESNVTWNTDLNASVLQDNKTNYWGYYEWNNFSVTDAVQSAYDSNASVYILIKYENETRVNGAFTGWGWKSKEFGSEAPYLKIVTSSGGGCSGYDDGAWCDDYNLTIACTYTNDIQPCYDVYTEMPNPFNATKRDFTVYNSSEEDCIHSVGTCPDGYMCVQYFNPVTHQYEAKVQCYNGQTGNASYYNESGQEFNGTEYTLNLTSTACIHPEYFNNSWTCQVNWCYWCYGSQQCTFNAESCEAMQILTNCTNTTTVCFDQYCNHVECTQDSVRDLRQWLNAGMGTPFGSDIISLIVAGVCSILLYINVKEKSINILVAPFLLVASAMSFVGLLTAWFLVLEVATIFVMVFWKTRGG